MSTAEAQAPAARRHVGEVGYLNLDQIWADPVFNARTAGYLPEELTELAASIAGTKGLIAPLVVCVTAQAGLEEHGKPYTLVAGFRRYHALLKLAEDEEDGTWIESVPCLVRSTSDMGELITLQLVENYQRKEMNPMDIAMAIDNAITVYGMNAKAFADKTGMSKGMVSQYRKLATLPATIRIMVEKEQISFTNARELLRLPAEHWEKAAEVARDMSGAAFASYVKRHLPNATAAEAANSDAATKADGSSAPAGDKGDDGEVGDDGKSTQRIVSTMRANTIKSEYIPKLMTDLEKAKSSGDEEAQTRLQYWVDGLSWVLHGQQAGDTELSAYLQDYEAERAKAKESEKANAESNKLAKEYVGACIKFIRDKIDPKNLEPGSGQRVPTIPEALAAVKKTFDADIAKLDESGKPLIGFTLPLTFSYKHDDKDHSETVTTTDEFIKFVHDRFLQDREARKAAAKRNAEKKAEEKALAEQKAADEKAKAEALAKAHPETEPVEA